jgi:hypothetical protein
MALNGVVGIATGLSDDGRVVLKILSDGSLAKISAPAAVEGVQVVTEVTGVIRALSYTAKENPVPTGVSTGNINECSAGTIGTVVEKNGIRYFLSNNHVFARMNSAAIGEVIVQPGLYDSQPQCDKTYPTPVATLAEFKRLTFFFGSNVIDAAIARINSSTAYVITTKAGFTPNSITKLAALNMLVKKCGRTTELTRGKVTGLNVSVWVNYNNRLARFTKQIQFSALSQAGDSGSLIVTDDSNENPVALLFAGSTSTTLGNPINDVLGNFGVKIVGR